MTDWDGALRALHRFCTGKERMRIPVQEDDDDLLIDRALEAGAAAEARVARLEAALIAAAMELSGSGARFERDIVHLRVPKETYRRFNVALDALDGWRETEEDAE